ncbi:MAG: hypothetical protein RL477_1713 [Pseudomonadota bacterium]
MPAVRFSRDKRGYEYVYLVHTPVKRGKPGRTRVLYWYRTPPGVRLGRKPFDDEVQRALERQNPGLTFDWDTIVNTPMPPPDMTEYWRERRRQEKALKAERRAAEAEEAALEQAAGATAPDSGVDGDQGEPDDAGLADQAGEDATAAPLAADGPNSPAASESAPFSDGRDSGRAPEADGASGSRKRRRRRGGRRRRGAGAAGAADGPDASADQSEAGDDEGSEPSDPQPPASEES